MNARQKAKKYKRLYEALLKPPVKYTVEQHNIDTLRFEHFYTRELVENYRDELRPAINDDIKRDFSKILFDKYVYYRTEFCPSMDMYRLYAEIKIVDQSCSR